MKENPDFSDSGLSFPESTEADGSSTIDGCLGGICATGSCYLSCEGPGCWAPCGGPACLVSSNYCS